MGRRYGYGEGKQNELAIADQDDKPGSNLAIDEEDAAAVGAVGKPIGGR
jgi:hypothetical protein